LTILELVILDGGCSEVEMGKVEARESGVGMNDGNNSKMMMMFSLFLFVPTFKKKTRASFVMLSDDSLP
jgi:hypothetical protein